MLTVHPPVEPLLSSHVHHFPLEELINKARGYRTRCKHVPNKMYCVRTADFFFSSMFKGIIIKLRIVMLEIW